MAASKATKKTIEVGDRVWLRNLPWHTAPSQYYIVAEVLPGGGDIVLSPPDYPNTKFLAVRNDVLLENEERFNFRVTVDISFDLKGIPEELRGEVNHQAAANVKNALAEMTPYELGRYTPSAVAVRTNIRRTRIPHALDTE
jgi:hypothetical protein